MPAVLLTILARASASPTVVSAGGHGGGRPWIAAAASAVLVVGLIVRLVAGRRLRHDR